MDGARKGSVVSRANSIGSTSASSVPNTGTGPGGGSAGLSRGRAVSGGGPARAALTRGSLSADDEDSDYPQEHYKESYKDQRRRAHTQAEQKRRNAIKVPRRPGAAPGAPRSALCAPFPFVLCRIGSHEPLLTAWGALGCGSPSRISV